MSSMMRITRSLLGVIISANCYKGSRGIQISNDFRLLYCSMFAEHYVQEEIANDERISVGKMFLYAPNKISDRLIYKVTPGTSKISITAK